MGAQGPAGRVAAFGYPESAARALGRAADRADWLRRPAGKTPEIEGIDREAARTLVTRRLESGGEGWLSAEETRTLLSAYRIPLVEERVATLVEEAASAAAELGFPAVVKSASPGAHKTETGGIALDLADENEVQAAAARIGTPVLVQPMVTGGPALLAGLVQDPVFGALVAFGPGGVFAELIGAADFRIAPSRISTRPSWSRAGRLVASWKGSGVSRPPTQPRSGTSCTGSPPSAAISRRWPELDLNPVLGLHDRCVAVDARVRVSPPVQPPRTKTW